MLHTYWKYAGQAAPQQEEPVYPAQWEIYRELHIVLFDHKLQEINENGWIHYPESEMGEFDIFVDGQKCADLSVEPFKNKGSVTIPVSTKAHQVYLQQGGRVHPSFAVPEGEEDFFCGTTCENGEFQIWDYEGDSLIN